MYYCKYCGKETENVVNEEVVCEECEKKLYGENLVYNTKTSKNNSIYSILTAIIYPLIALIIALTRFNSGEIRLFQFLLCILMSAGWVIVVILGGIYLLVIPLPIITFYRFGCTKQHLPLWLRIVNGIIAGLFYVFSYIIIFI